MIPFDFFCATDSTEISKKGTNGGNTCTDAHLFHKVNRRVLMKPQNDLKRAGVPTRLKAACCCCSGKKRKRRCPPLRGTFSSTKASSHSRSLPTSPRLCVCPGVQAPHSLVIPFRMFGARSVALPVLLRHRLGHTLFRHPQQQQQRSARSAPNLPPAPAPAWWEGPGGLRAPPSTANQGGPCKPV